MPPEICYDFTYQKKSIAEIVQKATGSRNLGTEDSDESIFFPGSVSTGAMLGESCLFTLVIQSVSHGPIKQQLESMEFVFRFDLIGLVAAWLFQDPSNTASSEKILLPYLP